MKKEGRNKGILTIVFVLIAVLVLVISLAQLLNYKIYYGTKNSVSIANPASTYCIAQGGNFSIETDRAGGQIGNCILKDGKVCEEWAYFRGECGNLTDITECVQDSDCVPASCCHASSCVPIANAPDCSKLLCTMNCALGTLDCGQGSCKCVNNKCAAVLK